MSDKNVAQVTGPCAELMAYTNRKAVSFKEKIGYIVYDSSQSFNLNSQKETFVDSILGINFNLQSLNNLIGGTWDIINDILIGALVDRTRTRWGKFRPYLFAVALPLAIFSAVYVGLLQMVCRAASTLYAIHRKALHCLTKTLPFPLPWQEWLHQHRLGHRLRLLVSFEWVCFLSPYYLIFKVASVNTANMMPINQKRTVSFDSGIGIIGFCMIALMLPLPGF